MHSLIDDTLHCYYKLFEQQQLVDEGRGGTGACGLSDGGGGVEGDKRMRERKGFRTPQLPVFLLVDGVIQALPLGRRVGPASAI